MRQSNLLEILQELNSEYYITVMELSEKLHLGERTVRYRLKTLNEILIKNGACIDSKPRYGSKLVITDHDQYDRFLEQSILDADAIPVPDTASERVSFLLAFLLNKKGYTKLDDMCEFMYISKGTLTTDLKQVEFYFQQYNISVERRPNYGIRAVGSELDFRRCVGDFFIKWGRLKPFGEQRKEEELKKLANTVMFFMRKHNVKFSETALENFIYHIYVAVKRISRGNEVHLKKEDIQNLNDEEWTFVEELSGELAREYQITYSEAEKMYVAVHLAGKRMVGSGDTDAINFVVRSDLDQLALQMLEMVYQEFHIDLRNAFEFRMALNQHMVPFDIRMHFDIPLLNPLLSEIKGKYMMGYRVASVSSVVLAKHYRREIPEDEIGYFALLFELVLEQRNGLYQDKRNILLVCSSGKGSSRLLKYQYQKELEGYLDHIYVCDLQELETFDFTKVDYVFTTVPIIRPIPVPIMEIGLFLGEHDINNVKRVLNYGKIDFLYKYYDKAHFYTDIKGENRTDILKGLCARVINDHRLDNEFTDLVLRREELGSTDYGNMVAIPHPLQTVTDESFVYVAVLERPVLWNRYDVQVVFLTVIGKNEDKDIQKFYEMTTEYIVNEEAVRRLIERREFETLMEGFEKISR